MIIFGAMLLAIHNMVRPAALALLTVRLVPHSILVIAIIVNQAIQMAGFGMASSVKAPAALVPTPLHGSVYGFLIQQLMQLK